jgi:hypothetical protein
MATIRSNPVTLYVSASQPAWVSALPDSGAWAELSASPVFTTWLTANVSPPSGYRGSDPLAAIRDAFCNPAWDALGKAAYLFGGGHSNGSCNAVIKFDAATLRYSIVIPPTPPSAYPPAFTDPNSPITYPSGSNLGYFQTANTLTDPRDQPFAAPFAAPPATHTYAGMTAYNGKLQLLYGNTPQADLNRATWDVSNLNRFGPQLSTLYGGGDQRLGEGTQAIVDTVTEKTWVVVSPGSAGDNSRSYFAKIDTATGVVEARAPTWLTAPDYWGFVGAESVCIHGRQLYVLQPVSIATSYMNGWRLDMDSAPTPSTPPKLRLIGDIPRINATNGAIQENMPCFSNGAYVFMWNFSSEPDVLYRVNTAPISGDGTGSSPFLLNVTRLALPASGMPAATSVYRLDYIDEWGVVMVLPSSGSRWWAMKVPA